MSNSVFQIFFLIFRVFLIWLSYKAKFLLIYNYISGLFMILFFANLHLKDCDGRAKAIVFISDLFFYTTLFFSSFIIYFDKGNEKKHYVIIPVFAYFV